MKNTPIYHLPYLSPGQSTGEDLGFDKRRFETMERQLLWLFSIYGGNGVVDNDPSNPSWRIQAIPGYAGADQVQISSGKGQIGFKACSSIEPTIVQTPIPIGSPTTWTYWFYAETVDSSPSTGSVQFIASLSVLDASTERIGLGGVVFTVTDSGTVLTIFNTVEYGRQEITFFGLVGDLVAKHKHIGGARNPSPISLKHNVQGKLDGSMVDNLDLSTADHGTLDARLLAQISHDKLSDKGTLRHVEIEALLSETSPDLANRFGDITIANLLQIVLSDLRSGNISTYHNLIATRFYVPGITPDSYFSYNSNYGLIGLTNINEPLVPDGIDLALIDKSNHYIKAGSASPRNAITVSWDDDSEFDFEISRGLIESVAADPKTQRVQVIGIDDSAYLELEKPLNYTKISTTNLATWNTGHIFLDRSTGVPAAVQSTSFNDDYDVERYLLYTIAESNWSELSKLSVSLSFATDDEPGSVKLYLIVGSGVVSKTIQMIDGTESKIELSNLYVLCDADHTPTTSHTYVVALSDLIENELLTQVRGIALSWGTATGWNKRDLSLSLSLPADDDIPASLVDYRLDNGDTTTAIFAWNDIYYASSGRFVARYDSGSTGTLFTNVQIASSGSSIKTRYRIADTKSGLSDAQILSLPNNGSLNNAKGRWIDVIVDFSRVVNKITSPHLDTVAVSALAQGSQAEYIWEGSDANKPGQINQWSKAAIFENLTLVPEGNISPQDLVLSDIAQVGNWTFLRQDGPKTYSVNNVETPTLTPILPSSPITAWKGLLNGSIQYATCWRLIDGKNYIVDYGSDRVVCVDNSNNISSVIVANDRLRQTALAFVALSALYNPIQKILWIMFSRNINILDLTKMTISHDSQQIGLDAAGLKVSLFMPDDAGTSATVQVQMVEPYASWLKTGNAKIVIDNLAVEALGDNSGSDGSDNTDVPNYFTQLAELLTTDSFKPDFSNVASDGTIATSVNAILGIFDDTITALQGPGKQINIVTLNIESGPYIVDRFNLPRSVAVLKDGTQILLTAGSETVIAWNNNLSRLWSLASTDVIVPSTNLGNVAVFNNEKQFFVSHQVDEASEVTGKIFSLLTDTPQLLRGIKLPGNIVDAADNSQSIYVLITTTAGGTVYSVSYTGVVKSMIVTNILENPRSIEIVDTNRMVICQ